MTVMSFSLFIVKSFLPETAGCVHKDSSQLRCHAIAEDEQKSPLSSSIILISFSFYVNYLSREESSSAAQTHSTFQPFKTKRVCSICLIKERAEVSLPTNIFHTVPLSSADDDDTTQIHHHFTLSRYMDRISSSDTCPHSGWASFKSFFLFMEIKFKLRDGFLFVQGKVFYTSHFLSHPHRELVSSKAF